MSQLIVGDLLSSRELRSMYDEPIRIPDPARLTHLMFRRYAGAPIDTRHLRRTAERHGDILAAGVREIAVFHSTAARLRRCCAGLPFPVVPDPGRVLYAELEVPAEPTRSVLGLHRWWAAGRALGEGYGGPGTLGWGEWHRGLPADVLARPDGEVVAVRYGRHVEDHWSVDDLLRIATDGR